MEPQIAAEEEPSMEGPPTGGHTDWTVHVGTIRNAKINLKKSKRESQHTILMF
jgi:hypothetical protein